MTRCNKTPHLQRTVCLLLAWAQVSTSSACFHAMTRAMAPLGSLSEQPPAPAAGGGERVGLASFLAPSPSRSSSLSDPGERLSESVMLPREIISEKDHDTWKREVSPLTESMRKTFKNALVPAVAPSCHKKTGGENPGSCAPTRSPVEMRAAEATSSTPYKAATSSETQTVSSSCVGTDDVAADASVAKRAEATTKYLQQTRQLPGDLLVDFSRIIDEEQLLREPDVDPPAFRRPSSKLCRRLTLCGRRLLRSFRDPSLKRAAADAGKEAFVSPRWLSSHGPVPSSSRRSLLRDHGGVFRATFDETRSPERKACGRGVPPWIAGITSASLRSVENIADLHENRRAEDLEACTREAVADASESPPMRGRRGILKRRREDLYCGTRNDHTAVFFEGGTPEKKHAEDATRVFNLENLQPSLPSPNSSEDGGSAESSGGRRWLLSHLRTRGGHQRQWHPPPSTPETLEEVRTPDLLRRRKVRFSEPSEVVAVLSQKSSPKSPPTTRDRSTGDTVASLCGSEVELETGTGLGAARRLPLSWGVEAARVSTSASRRLPTFASTSAQDDGGYGGSRG